ncbi:hypothetical protein MOQ72_10195 [Saccharopolyspora sp. K220]|uniref:hypothetical protein n=1 Tax=Saccharopolyspora soli TaxID=2926618 RepID=UPI001F5ACBCB|nr:hypothetical protein [Saccharopolyspora soli]MCI2417795.1 hypothetical protein [Saccharopolyspora soli]
MSTLHMAVQLAADERPSQEVLGVHRSWLRTKVAESKTRMASKVTERAKSLIPMQRDGETDACMVCGRTMRPAGAVRGEGRVCSPACARQWAEGLS